MFIYIFLVGLETVVEEFYFCLNILFGFFCNFSFIFFFDNYFFCLEF